MLLLAAAPAMMTSCDDPWHDDFNGDWYDDYDWYDDPYDHSQGDLLTMSQMLNGVWTGTIINEYTDDNGQRQQTRMLADMTFVQYTTKSNNGTGYETDYAQRVDANGNLVYDSQTGNPIYDSQTLQFKWYIDPRTYNINIEYASGYRFVLDANGNSNYSGFSLGYNEFNGVMEGVNNDEYVFFDLQHVTSAHAPAKAPATFSARTFGKQTEGKRIDTNVPMMIRRR